MRPGPPALVLGIAALYVGLALLLAGRSLSEPGLYYDEVIQAGPALAFLQGEDVPVRVPGARATRVAGGWLPWMTQPYMGALKSQLLIPVFALLDANVTTLRATTLTWALLGLPFTMLLANRMAGLGVALLTGALLALDPSLLFLGRHDWGSFSLGFALRAAGLLGVLTGVRSGSVAATALGGFCLGLGIYNKIDFGVFVLACAAAALVVAPRRVADTLRSQPRQPAALLAGATAGALPLLLALPGALSVAGAATRRSGLISDLEEKWTVLRSVLDGSYFLRLMQAGGRFDDLAEVAGAGPALGFAVFVVSALVIAGYQAGGRLREHRAPLFFLATALLALAGIALVPGAVRAHHFLNAWPFPQLVVASAVVLLWAHGARSLRLPARVAAVLLGVAALGSALHVDVLTLRDLRESGARGRWSHVVKEIDRRLPPDRRLVSLDWGFDAPLRFLAPERDTEEPVWRLRRGSARISGDAESVYLTWEPDYGVMPYGEALLAALQELPAGAAEVRVYRDGVGNAVARSIRFTRPHDLVYRRGEVDVRLR